MSSHDDLPAALPAMWRALKRGYAAEPGLLVVAFGLSLLAAVPDALLALLLKLLADGVLAHERRLVLAAAVGLGAGGHRDVVPADGQHSCPAPVSRPGDHRAGTARGPAAGFGGDHRAPRAPLYLNRLAVLRDQVFVLDHMYMSLFSTCGWILRLAVTVALLMSIHPALALLAAFALPTVFASTWRPGVERAAEEQGAPSNRLARHLFVTATTAPPGKEVRVTGIGDRLVAGRRAGLGTLVRTRGRGPLGECPLAHAGVDGFRRRLRRGRSVHDAGAPCDTG